MYTSPIKTKQEVAEARAKASTIGLTRRFTGKPRGKDCLWILVACAVLFFAGLGSWGLIDPGDGYFTEAAREMIESGDYVTPHLNYQIYFSKPILIYWLIAGAYKVFGVNEFAARFWSAAAASLVALSVYWTLGSLQGRRAGLLAAGILCSAPLFITFAHMALVDMLFSSLLGIALCATMMTVIARSKTWWPLLYVCLALAVLTKGPAGVLLFGAGVISYFLIDYENFFTNLGRLRLHFGIPIFCAIAIPWYYMVGQATGGLWTKVFFLFENFGRFSGQTNHKVPHWWFYLGVIAYGFFPYSLFVPGALKDSFQRRQGLEVLTAQEEIALQSRRMLASWVFAITILFSVAQCKLQTYILPAFPALAMLVAMVFDKWAAQQEVRPESSSLYLTVISKMLFGLGVLSGICAAGIGLTFLSPDLLRAISNNEWTRDLALLFKTLPAWTLVASTVALGGLAAAYITQTNRLRGTQGNLACSSWIIYGTLWATAIGSVVAFAIGYQFKDADLHSAASYLNDKQGNIAIYQEFKPTVMFKLKRPVDTFFSTEQVLPLKQADVENAPTQYILTSVDGAVELNHKHAGKLKLVATNQKWCVLESKRVKVFRLPTLEETFAKNMNLSVGDYSWGTLPFAGGTKPFKKTY